MTALSIEKAVAIIGAGTMGAGIAQVAAKAGHPVLLFDVVAGAAERGITKTSNALDKLVSKGRMSAEEKAALVARITPTECLEDLAPAALVIEAIVEDLETKQTLFQALEAICNEDVIFGSNTSSLSITSIASALKNPQRLVGMHFFNPAPIMKLIEVISGLATDKQVAETVFDTAIAWGKYAVHASSTPGFIVNRVARPFYAEALRVLQEGGCDPATFDAIMRESAGFRMGPFELMDLIGHDVNYAVTCSVHNAYYGDPRYTPSLRQKALVDAGYLGRKSGQGFYNYAQGAKKPKPATAEPTSPPDSVTLIGSAPYATALITLLEDANILAEREAAAQNNDLVIIAGEATMALCDGRMATQVAMEDELDNLVLFDLALDYEQATRIALAPADQASAQAINDAIGFWQALGKQVSVIDDIPGMCVMRTVSMLINEGADAVNQGVCDASSVDTAMQYGVNYPQGPMNWGDKIGIGTVAEVLDQLAKTYGEDRYRTSPLLIRKICADNTLLENQA